MMTTDERLDALAVGLTAFQLQITTQITQLSEQVKNSMARADAADIMRERFDGRLTAVEHQIWTWSGAAAAVGTVGGAVMAKLFGV
jgi:hypothetical protein